MVSLKKCLDKITAEEELKEKTKINVLNAVMEKENKTIDLKKIFSSKRIVTVATAVAACIALTIGSYAFYMTPVNFVSVDINPGVDLGLNFLHKIVQVEGSNEDGKKFITQIKIKNMSIENAIKIVLQKAEDMGYVESDGSTVIAVTAQSNNKNKVLELKKQTEDTIQQMLTEQNISAIIYSDSTNIETRNDAKKEKVSINKYKIIKAIKEINPKTSIKKLEEAKVGEIIQKADQIMNEKETKKVLSKETKETRIKIKIAAKQIKENRKKAKKQKHDKKNDKKSQDSEINTLPTPTAEIDKNKKRNKKHSTPTPKLEDDEDEEDD